MSLYDLIAIWKRRRETAFEAMSADVKADRLAAASYHQGRAQAIGNIVDELETYLKSREPAL